MEAQTGRLAADNYHRAGNVQKCKIHSGFEEKLKMSMSFFKWIIVGMWFLAKTTALKLTLYLEEYCGISTHSCEFTHQSFPVVHSNVGLSCCFFFLLPRCLLSVLISWMTLALSAIPVMSRCINWTLHASFHHCWVKGDYWSCHLPHLQAACQTW